MNSYIDMHSYIRSYMHSYMHGYIDTSIVTYTVTSYDFEDIHNIKNIL